MINAPKAAQKLTISHVERRVVCNFVLKETSFLMNLVLSTALSSVSPVRYLRVVLLFEEYEAPQETHARVGSETTGEPSSYRTVRLTETIVIDSSDKVSSKYGGHDEYNLDPIQRKRQYDEVEEMTYVRSHSKRRMTSPDADSSYPGDASPKGIQDTSPEPPLLSLEASQKRHLDIEAPRLRVPVDSKDVANCREDSNHSSGRLVDHIKRATLNSVPASNTTSTSISPNITLRNIHVLARGYNGHGGDPMLRGQTPQSLPIGQLASEKRRSVTPTDGRRCEPDTSTSKEYFAADSTVHVLRESPRRAPFHPLMSCHHGGPTVDSDMTAASGDVPHTSDHEDVHVPSSFRVLSTQQSGQLAASALQVPITATSLDPTMMRAYKNAGDTPDINHHFLSQDQEPHRGDAIATLNSTSHRAGTVLSTEVVASHLPRDPQCNIPPANDTDEQYGTPADLRHKGYMTRSAVNHQAPQSSPLDISGSDMQPSFLSQEFKTASVLSRADNALQNRLKYHPTSSRSSPGESLPNSTLSPSRVAQQRIGSSQDAAELDVHTQFAAASTPPESSTSVCLGEERTEWSPFIQGVEKPDVQGQYAAEYILGISSSSASLEENYIEWDPLVPGLAALDVLATEYTPPITSTATSVGDKVSDWDPFVVSCYQICSPALEASSSLSAEQLYDLTTSSSVPSLGFTYDVSDDSTSSECSTSM